MSFREISARTLQFSAVLLNFAPLLPAEAQDVDVQGNLTMHNSTDPTVGNILKEGVPFIHNFGSNNTFLGSGAGNFTMTGDSNTASGAGALFSNTTGSNNTASGDQALFSNTSGNNNIAIGRLALFSNTTGSNNSASGAASLYLNTTGDANTATGIGALEGNTTGNSNTASGFLALVNNSTGNFNTATGPGALEGNTTGNSNTASGFLALVNNSTGNFNTAVGAYALFYTTGSYNTAIGYRADVFQNNLTNATAIGFGAVVNASNKIRFGNAQVTVIEGEVPYTYTSDRNQKDNFRPVKADEVLTKLRRLSVTSWNYKGQDAKQFRHYGPVAQDFFAAFGHDAVGTIGTPTTITSGDLDGILMIAAQALEKRTVKQTKQISALRMETHALRAENAELKARLEALERRVGHEVATEARVNF